MQLSLYKSSSRACVLECRFVEQRSCLNSECSPEEGAYTMETGCKGHQPCPVNILELVQGENYLMVHPPVKDLELLLGFP